MQKTPSERIEVVVQRIREQAGEVLSIVDAVGALELSQRVSPFVRTDALDYLREAARELQDIINPRGGSLSVALRHVREIEAAQRTTREVLRDAWKQLGAQMDEARTDEERRALQQAMDALDAQIEAVGPFVQVGGAR